MSTGIEAQLSLTLAYHPPLFDMHASFRWIRAKANVEHLSNRNIISLVENYFTEMALIISELGRLITPGGSLLMVNDNVRYHGEEIPVDLILSDFAEQSGFHCETIWTLKQGKGNSSQQMGRYGRQEIRKCVYHWRKCDG